MKIVAHDSEIGDIEICDACVIGGFLAVKPKLKPWMFLHENSYVDGVVVFERDPSVFISNTGKCVEGDTIFNDVIESYHSYLCCK